MPSLLDEDGCLVHPERAHSFAGLSVSGTLESPNSSSAANLDPLITLACRHAVPSPPGIVRHEALREIHATKNYDRSLLVSMHSTGRCLLFVFFLFFFFALIIPPPSPVSIGFQPCCMYGSVCGNLVLTTTRGELDGNLMRTLCTYVVRPWTYAWSTLSMSGCTKPCPSRCTETC